MRWTSYVLQDEAIEKFLIWGQGDGSVDKSTFLHKPRDQSFILFPHTWEGENQILEVVT